MSKRKPRHVTNDEVDQMFYYVAENQPCSAKEVSAFIGRSETGVVGPMMKDPRFIIVPSKTGERAWGVQDQDNPNIIVFPHRPYGERYFSIDYTDLFEKLRARR